MNMFSLEREAGFVDDREDLIAILRMRFSYISPRVIQAIYEIDEVDTLERLILVAANAPKLSVFLEELEEGTGNFRILGDRFNPIEQLTEGRNLYEKNE